MVYMEMVKGHQNESIHLVEEKQTSESIRIEQEFGSSGGETSAKSLDQPIICQEHCQSMTAVTSDETEAAEIQALAKR